MRKKYLAVLFPVIALALGIIFVGYQSVLNNNVDLRIVETNKPISEFNAKLLTGEKATLPSNDEVIVYEVFASWCIPCQKSVPKVLKFAEKNDVKLVGLAYRDVAFEVKKFQTEHGQFDSVIMSNGSVESAFSVRSVPQTLFVKNNKIIYRVYGQASVKDLERVLGLVESK